MDSAAEAALSTEIDATALATSNEEMIMRYALALHSRLCILDSVPSQSVYSRTLSTLDSSTIESIETRARIRKHRECENADYRESRLQGVQNRECRECESSESRGGSTVHDESTV